MLDLGRRARSKQQSREPLAARGRFLPIHIWLPLLASHRGDGTADQMAMTILQAQFGEGDEPGVLTYTRIVKQIEKLNRGGAGTLPLNEVVALVDCINPARMDAIATDGDWSRLIALLVLTFPEIKWVFCGSRRSRFWLSLVRPLPFDSTEKRLPRPSPRSNWSEGLG
jgi:hypothetical protein